MQFFQERLSGGGGGGGGVCVCVCVGGGGSKRTCYPLRLGAALRSKPLAVKLCCSTQPLFTGYHL